MDTNEFVRMLYYKWIGHILKFVLENQDEAKRDDVPSWTI